MRVSRAGYVVLCAILLIVAGVTIEVLRCGRAALPRTVAASDLATYAGFGRAYGRPDYEITLEPADLRTGTDERVLRSVTGHAALKASIWERECFCVASQRLLVVSDTGSGRVVSMGGHWRHVFPTLVLSRLQ